MGRTIRSVLALTYRPYSIVGSVRMEKSLVFRHSIMVVLLSLLLFEKDKSCSVMCPTGETPCGNYDSVCTGLVGCAGPGECLCKMVEEKEVCTIGLPAGRNCGCDMTNTCIEKSCHQGLECEFSGPGFGTCT